MSSRGRYLAFYRLRLAGSDRAESRRYIGGAETISAARAMATAYRLSAAHANNGTTAELAIFRERHNKNVGVTAYDIVDEWHALRNGRVRAAKGIVSLGEF